MVEPTPEALASAIEVPWGTLCGHLVVDDKELRRRIAAALRDYAAAEVAREREACARAAELAAAEWNAKPGGRAVSEVVAAAVRQRGEGTHGT